AQLLGRELLQQAWSLLSQPLEHGPFSAEQNGAGFPEGIIQVKGNQLNRHDGLLFWSTVFFAFGAGMGLVINLGQMLKVQVSVYLGGGNIGMPQQFLDSSQITAGLQQVAGKGVAQHMGVQTV